MDLDFRKLSLGGRYKNQRVSRHPRQEESENILREAQIAPCCAVLMSLIPTAETALGKAKGCSPNID